MKIIDEVSKKYKLSEAGHGQKEVQMAFIDGKTGHTITPFCMCKDYFNDMFYSNKTKNELTIYGFKWIPNQDKGILDRNVLTIAVRLRDRNSKKILDLEEEQRMSVFSLLSKFAKANNLGRLIVRMCEEKKNLIIYFNKKWTELPYLNSAFFLFVRLGFTYRKNEEVLTWYDKAEKFISPNDACYFKSAKNKIEDLLKGKIDNNQKYENYDVSSIHNGSGLVSYNNYKVD